MCIHRVYCSYIQPTIGNRLFMLVVSLSQESLMKEKFSLKHIMVYFPRKGWPTNRLSTNQPFVDIGCTKDRLRRGYWGYTHPTFRRNPNNWYINPYYWVDDHPPLYGNNGSLDSERADGSIHMVMPQPLVGGSKPISQSVSHWYGSLDPGTYEQHARSLRNTNWLFFVPRSFGNMNQFDWLDLRIFFKCVAQRPS